MESLLGYGLIAFFVVFIVNALNESFKDNLKSRQNEVKEDDYRNSKNFNDYLDRLEKTKLRAKTIEVPMCLAYVERVSDKETVHGFLVKDFDFDCCSDSVAVVTLKGVAKSYEFTTINGIKLLDSKDAIHFFNLDSLRVCKIQRRTPLDYDPIKDGIMNRVVRHPNHKIEILPHKRHWEVIGVTDDTSNLLGLDVNAISIFKKFESAFELMEKNKIDEHQAKVKDFQLRRDDYINKLID